MYIILDFMQFYKVKKCELFRFYKSKYGRVVKWKSLKGRMMRLNNDLRASYRLEMQAFE